MKTKPIAHFTRNILEDSIFCTYSVSRIMSVVTACASDRISRQVLYSLAADPREDWDKSNLRESLAAPLLALHGCSAAKKVLRHNNPASYTDYMNKRTR